MTIQIKFALFCRFFCLCHLRQVFSVSSIFTSILKFFLIASQHLPFTSLVEVSLQLTLLYSSFFFIIFLRTSRHSPSFPAFVYLPRFFEPSIIFSSILIVSVFLILHFLSSLSVTLLFFWLKEKYFAFHPCIPSPLLSWLTIKATMFPSLSSIGIILSPPLHLTAKNNNPKVFPQTFA